MSLIGNPNFETGSLPPWTTTTPFSVTTGTRVWNTVSQSSPFSVLLRSGFSTPVNLSQTGIATVANGNYTLTFWMNNLGSATDVVTLRVFTTGFPDTVNVTVPNGTANIWVQRTYNFVAKGPITIFFQNNSSFEKPDGIALDTFTLVQNIVCYPPTTKIYCKNILTNTTEYLSVDKVKKDTHLVLNGNGEFIPIVHNAICGSHNKFIKIPKNCAGKNEPNEDLLITSGHTVIYRGQLMKAKNVPGSKRIRTDSLPLYTIVTENLEYILVQGMYVFTHSNKQWEKHCDEKAIGWCEN